MDEIDRANGYADEMLKRKIEYISNKAKMDKGRQGECDLCGEWSGRLINDVCAPCRDRYKMK
jgi:hypothetical protein